jgi:hypothetical protein
VIATIAAFNSKSYRQLSATYAASSKLQGGEGKGTD